MFIRPTASERSPRFKADVRKAIFAELPGSPFRSCLVSRRASEPAAIDICEVKSMVHHFRVLKSFGLDAIDCEEIGFLFSEKQKRKRYSSPNPSYSAIHRCNPED